MRALFCKNKNSRADPSFLCPLLLVHTHLFFPFLSPSTPVPPPVLVSASLTCCCLLPLLPVADKDNPHTTPHSLPMHPMPSSHDTLRHAWCSFSLLFSTPTANLISLPLLSADGWCVCWSPIAWARPCSVSLVVYTAFAPFLLSARFLFAHKHPCVDRRPSIVRLFSPNLVLYSGDACPSWVAPVSTLPPSRNIPPVAFGIGLEWLY